MANLNTSLIVEASDDDASHPMPVDCLRKIKDVSLMLLPESPIPRPGESVIYYNDTYRGEGILEGHGPEAKPHVRNVFSNTAVLDSFDLVRSKDPTKRRGAAWNYLPPGSLVVEPSPTESQTFKELLERYIPPGPRYIDLVDEIWARGFEVFLVGGTVRDVLAGQATHDVDLVTTMPLTIAKRLLEAMFRRKPEIHPTNGYVRLGGTPSSKDPFIDLKMFSQFSAGGATALFGADFALDVAHRDFDCNAIYYDPKNNALIDPTGRGILNAQHKILELVCNPQLRNPHNLAQIVVRFFKFLSRGYTATETTCECIRNEFLPRFPSMKAGIRIGYIRTQVLSKSPSDQHKEKLELFRAQFISFGMEALWDEHIEPFKSQILG